MDPLLLPVLSALGGVALAQGVAMLQSWLDRENKREILFRTKYEELGLHFLDSMRLPHALMEAKTTEAILALTHQSSANKAHLLAMVYFPLLQKSIGAYTDTYSNLCVVAMSLYSPEDKRELGIQVHDKPAYIGARNSHVAARDNLQDQIRLHAHLYTKS